MSRPQNANEKLSRGESVEVAQKDGQSASGEALPEGWAWATLKEIVNSITYGHTASASDKPVGPRFLRITDIQGGRVDWESVPFCECDDVEKYALKNGDIVIARTGATTGKNFLIGDLNEPSVFASYLIRLETLEDLSAEFLSHFMQTPHYWQQITTVSKGSAQPGANATILSKLAIPVAPKAEQSRIVSAIESLQERSSRARVLLSEVGPLIGQLRQSVLRDAFSGKLTRDWRRQNPAPSGDPERLRAGSETASELLLRIRTERRERWQSEQLAKYEAKGKQPPKNWQDKYKEPEPVDESELPELPDGWCWTPLELIATHQSGFAFKSKHFADEGIQVVKLGNLYQGRFDLTRDPAYLPEDHEDADAALIHVGDILVSQTGTRHKRDYGYFVLIPEGTKPLLLNQRVLAVRSIDPALTEWIVFASRSEFYRDYFFSTETGGVNQGNVGVGGIMRGPIPLAPMAEMKEITSRLEECSRATSFTTAEIASMESSLTQLDQSILSKAFRGELVPQDSGDEPASELLARIRTTRAQLEAEKKAAKKKPKTGTARRKK